MAQTWWDDSGGGPVQRGVPRAAKGKLEPLRHTDRPQESFRVPPTEHIKCRSLGELVKNHIIYLFICLFVKLLTWTWQRPTCTFCNQVSVSRWVSCWPVTSVGAPKEQ